MELATYIVTVLAVIVAAHAVLYGMCAAWHNKRSYVVRHGEGATRLDQLDDGLAKAAAMRADPPWYIRYADWLERKVTRR